MKKRIGILIFSGVLQIGGFQGECYEFISYITKS